MQDWADGTCIIAEPDHYVDEPNASPSAKKRCPQFSFSPAGSDSLLDCDCHETRDLQEVSSTSFKCLCEAGRYQSDLSEAECILCNDNICGVNQYLANCSDTHRGDCFDCDDSKCSSDQKLVNCGVGYAHLSASYGGPGKCKAEYQLVRTPLCPEKVNEIDLTVEVPEARTALGDYDFETVFGITYEHAPFQCRVACDGKGTSDTTFCDGPFACNMKTCVQSMPARTTASQLPPVRVCPVVITEDDLAIIDIMQAKRSTSCVSCSECGHIPSTIPDWGRGCCKECSRLMCEQDEIYDWTTRSCKPCSALQDVRLCSTADRAELSMELQKVSGYLPFLRFKNCIGGANVLDDITYGTCESCVEDLKYYTCNRAQYLASCQEPNDVCQSCVRESLGNVQLSVVQQNWQRRGVDHVLYCQITACNSRNNLNWTGVLANGEMCQHTCETADELNCADDEYVLPCILPHRSRCMKIYPLHNLFTPVLLIKDEVNLLNEYPDAAFDGQQRHKFASFENTVITLNNPLYEYQCVWNSRAIFDNENNPAGVSHVFWSPQQTMSSEFALEGSKACADWPFTGTDLEDSLPLLPLQNTVALASEELTAQFVA